MGTNSPPKGKQPPIFGRYLLWTNGWMNQDATWYGGRPRPRPHLLDGDPAPTKGHKTSPQFSAHVCCGRTAGWINIPFGTDVGLVPDDIVIHGDPAPRLKRATHPTFRPMSIVAKLLLDQDATWYEGRPRPRPHCVRWRPSFPRRGTNPQFSARVYCGQTVAHLSYC